MELYRLHFPRSAGEEVTLEGQGQPNQRTFAGQSKKLKLSKKVSDQSKIRQMINALKPGTDGIAPVLFQQGVEHLTTHNAIFIEPA